MSNSRDWPTKLWDTHAVEDLIDIVIVYLLPQKHVADLLLRGGGKTGFKQYVKFSWANKYTSKYMHIKIQKECKKVTFYL